MSPHGKSAIRRPGVKSKSLVAEEIRKCISDPVYYLNMYGVVQTPKEGYTRLTLYDFQEEVINDIKNNRFNIVLKSRQLGLSTISAGYAAWLISFFPGKSVVVIANKEDVAKNFLKKVRLFVKKTPNWLKPKIVTDNKTSIEMANGSVISAHATTADAARSEALSLLIIDEAAVIDSHKVDDLWTAAYPTLSLGGSALVISTPRGVGNFFHRQWVAAESNESKFNPIKLHWIRHPIYSKDTTYDEKGNPTSPWYEEQKAEIFAATGDHRRVSQELDCDFVGSGDNVILAEYMKEIEKTVMQPIDFDAFDNNLWIWEDPIIGLDYFICADVARGDGSDYSAFHVIKRQTREQVAEYKAKLPPDMLAKLIHAVGIRYNEALVAVEANTYGYSVCTKLVEMKYPNIFYSLPSHFNARNRKNLERDLADKEKMVPGFQTTSTTRPLVITELEESIRLGKVTIHSARLFNELKTFIWNNGKAEAQSGYNDDLCISLGIGMLIIETLLEDFERHDMRTITMLETMVGESTDASTFDILNSGIMKQQDPYIITMGDDEVDLRDWLIPKRF